MYRSCVEMLWRHPWVLSMDCTYKTNRYGLPLLDIVSLVSTGQTCFIAFAFIRDEKQDTYETVLECLAEAYRALNLQYPRTILTDKERALINAINVVFPNTKTISCIWHIEMNILKKARPLLSDQIAIARRDGVPLPADLDLDPTQSNRPTTKERLQDELRKLVDKGWKAMLQRWNQVVYTDLEATLNQRWSSFKASYADPVFQPIIAYIQAEWLNDCPEQFLHLYTSHYLHLGETATSRTEGAYWLLKKDLQISTNDLLKVLENFQRAIERQYANIRHQTAIEQHRRPTKLDSLYKIIATRISSKAIQKVEAVADQYLPKGVGKPPIPPDCLCNSKDTTGFPCIHIIKRYQDEQRGLEPELFHQHWYLYDLAEAPPIDPLLLVQDPLLIRRRGRPRGAANFVRPSQASSTQRSIQSTQQSIQSTQQSIQSTQQSTQSTAFDHSTHRELSAFEYILPPQERGRGGRGGRGGRRGGHGDELGGRRILRSSQRGQGDAE